MKNARKKGNNVSFDQVAEQVIKKCKEVGIKAFISNSSITTNSIYIKFQDPLLCSLRIGDHDGYEKYKYKFNLRADLRRRKIEKDGEIWRLFFPMRDINGFIEALLERKEHIKGWDREKYLRSYNHK